MAQAAEADSADRLRESECPVEPAAVVRAWVREELADRDLVAAELADRELVWDRVKRILVPAKAAVSLALRDKAGARRRKARCKGRRARRYKVQGQVRWRDPGIFRHRGLLAVQCRRAGGAMLRPVFAGRDLRAAADRVPWLSKPA